MCRMSLTDEQINLLDFDSTQTFDSEQKSLFSTGLETNGATTVTTAAHIVPSTQHAQQQHTITASVPHQPQLTTTMSLSPELIEKSKSALEINVQAEYKVKVPPPPVNLNGPPVDDDDFIPPEPPARTDYGKKALVGPSSSPLPQDRRHPFCLGVGGAKLSSVEIHGSVSRIRDQLSHVVLQGEQNSSSRECASPSILQAMSVPEAVVEDVPDDAVESVDDDANEVIMMDPKNFYMVYLLKTSAFLHSCVAFLMMISYYKLKVKQSTPRLLGESHRCLRSRWSFSNGRKRSLGSSNSKAPGSSISPVRTVPGFSPICHGNGTSWSSVPSRFPIVIGTNSSRRKCETNTRISSITMN